ncbi:MAG: SusC/RagA family TonB-linked outer membrane protein [Tannerella sp.]|nr:SusC/RagA family TonB-linked outer membrane protein [Tannerella sp.]
MHAQQGVSVSGTVSDNTGEPLPGVNITVKGSTAGVISDIDGKYVITAPGGNAVLVFMYVGFATQEVTVGSQRVIDITLSESNIDLDEVVVIAYGSSKKRDLTGSVTSIAADQIQVQQVSTASRALEGLVAGVQFANLSGQPGSESAIQVRGLGSITGSTSPLIVVDGVATSFSLNSINPNDIESIVVSKDAAANALYGSRAAHGLVLVTTKKGKSGKTKINVDMRFGSTSRGVPDYDKVSDPADFYEYTWKGIYNFINYAPDRAEQFKSMSDQELRQYASDNLFKQNGNTNSARNGLGNYMLYRIPEGTTLIDPSTGKLRGDAQLLYNDDWQDYFLQHSFRQEYNANISGSVGDKTDYYFSLGYLSDPSYVMGSDFNRYSARMKVNTQITPWLKGGMNMSYSRTYSDAPNYTGGTVNTNVFTWFGYFAPINALFAHDQDGNVIRNENGKPTFDLGTGQTYSPYGTTARPAFNGYSPGIYFEKDLTETTANYLNGYTFLEASFLDGFKLKVDLNMDESHTLGLTYGNNESGADARDYKGTIYNRWARAMTINTTQLLTWEKNFDAHHVDVLAGHEYRWWTDKYMRGSKYNMFMTDQPSLANAIGTSYVDGAENSYALEGYLGKVNYNYNGKYYLSASLRTDGSSIFRNNKWATFYSVGGSYRISEEAFVKDNVSWLSELKLRANYGTLGNNNGIGAWNWTDIWQIANAGSIGSPLLSISQTGFGNTNLTWETVHTFDAGFDFRLFNRLYGSIDYFNRTTTDMLWNVRLAASTGQSAATQNAGEMQNSGIEVDLGVDLVRSKELLWSVGINLSHYANKLTKIPESVGSPLYDGAYVDGNYLRGAGKDYFNLYLYRYAGVDQETGLGLLYKTLTAADIETGNYAGKNAGDVVTTAVGSQATRFELGSASPDLVGGFNTNLRYRNIDFSLITSWQLGGKIVDLSYQGLTGQGIGRAIHADLLDAWTPDNKDSNIPMRMLGGTNYGSVPAGGSAGQYSDFSLFSASYLNLKSVSAGYTIPSGLLRKAFIENLRIYISGENLFLLSAKKGLDPRVSFGGAAVSAYGFPQAKVVSAGLNITF